MCVRRGHGPQKLCVWVYFRVGVYSVGQACAMTDVDHRASSVLVLDGTVRTDFPPTRYAH